MINRYVERFETIPLDMLDDIIEQLRQNNNRTLLKSIRMYFFCKIYFNFNLVFFVYFFIKNDMII